MIVKTDTFQQGYNYIIFDFDGTLANTEPGITLSMGKAVEYFGIDSSKIDFRKYIGPPIHDSFCELVGEKNSKKGVELYRKFYDEVDALNMCFLYNGIVELLEKLSKNFVLAVASSKHEPHVIQSVKNLGIDKFFVEVFGRTPKRPLKHLIVEQLLKKCKWDKSLTLMIGDTRFDIDGARKNDIDVLSVSYGYESRKNLLKLQPDALVDSVQEVERILGVCDRPQV